MRAIAHADVLNVRKGGPIFLRVAFICCRLGCEDVLGDRLVACAEERRRCGGKAAPQFAKVLDDLVASIDTRFQSGGAEGQPPRASGASAQYAPGAFKEAVICSGSVLDRSTTAKKMEHFLDVSVALGEEDAPPDANRHRSTYDRWETGKETRCVGVVECVWGM